MPRNQWPDKIGIGGRMIPEFAYDRVKMLTFQIPVPAYC